MPQNKNKKVCIVTISLGKGGAERSAAMLSRMLSRKGHQVHLVTLNDEIEFEYEGQLLNLGVEKTGSDNLWKRWRRLRQLRAYLKEHQIDVVIDHRPKNQYKRELFYHRYVYKHVERIYVTHSSKKDEYLTEQPQKFSKLCCENKANVAVARAIETEVLNAAGVANTRTIYNGYDPAWQQQQPPSVAVPKGKYFLWYGRMDDAIKDLDFLIQSFTESQLWKTGTSLVIMGDGPDKEKITKRAESLEAGSAIHFLPYVQQPFAIIQNAHAVLLTSRYEGFPMVLVESLSQGTPVISLDIHSGPAEIIQSEENGLLIPKRSLPLFAQALRRMVEEPSLHQHCKSQAQASVKGFSMEVIAEQWHELICE